MSSTLKWWLLAAILTTTLSTNIPCTFSNHCICIRSQDDYEFQCPPDIETNRIVMHVVPETKILIDCDKLDTLNVSILPNITVGPVKTFKMRMCPLPDGGFSTVFTQLGVESTETFKFCFYNLKDIRLKRTHFEKLHYLKELSLDSNDLIHLDDDIFRDLSDLVYLDLKNNQIDLSPGLFRNLSQLKWLDLAQNNLTAFPDGLFQDLNALKVLHLWTNNVRSLNRNIFRGLHSLISLELSFNKIENIDEDTFRNLANLINISLNSNNLKTISSNLFQTNTQLELIKMRNNPNLKLVDNLFSNLPKLKEIHMCHSNLQKIPDHIFNNSTSLRLIKMESNLLNDLPDDVFSGLIKLEELYMSNNSISNLNSDLFRSLANLRILHLEHNLLENLPKELFQHLTNLHELYLDNNEIKTIHLQAFPPTNNIEKISLSHNKYSFESSAFDPIFDFTPFNSCVNLEDLDLSHNSITEVKQDLFLNKRNLRTLNLRHNFITDITLTYLQSFSKFTKVDLSYNNITVVDFSNAEAIVKDQILDAASYYGPSTEITIGYNPIKCDCSALKLVQYFRNEFDDGVKTLIYIKPDNLVCAEPLELKNMNVEELLPSMLTCPLFDLINNYTTCADNCGCGFRPVDKTLLIDCSFRNLNDVPIIHLPDNLRFNQTEVHLEGNNLNNGPKRSIEYENVTKLFLNNNQIKNLSWIPPKIHVLKLDGNNIRRIDEHVLQMLKSAPLINLTLEGNPWICDCSTINMSSFVRQHLRQIDPNNLKCHNSTELVMNLNEAKLCHTPQILIYILLICMAIFTIPVTVMAFYYRYQQEVKVWLYSKNLCLWWVTEEELDKDKIYDAFISYSHKDEDFVAENLVPVLEGGSHPYKLCLHYRNFIPGEYIAKQVVNSVKDSRRTMVILSPNFLESVWGMMEFRTAHIEAMSEGRARVIVVLYDNVDVETLDDELKAYLKTNTYVKWGDPWFWDKLKYALPHVQRRPPKNSRKHANMMAKIDDKFSLEMPLNAESTPPVLTLDVDLLKMHPLSFGNTPPAESGALLKSTA